MNNFRLPRLSGVLRTTLAAIGALLTLGCFGCGHAPLPPEHATTSSGKGYASAANELGIEHAARVAPGIYRGAQPTGRGLVNLKNQGFRTVVNLRSHHSERRAVEDLGMKCVEIPMRADIVSEAPSQSDVFRFLDTVLDPSNQPVFFHCAHGCDRAGTMAAIYRIEAEGWSPQEALEEMRAFGCSEIYAELIRYVENYRRVGFWRDRMRPRVDPTFAREWPTSRPAGD